MVLFFCLQKRKVNSFVFIFFFLNGQCTGHRRIYETHDWITQVETSHVDTASKIIDNANANVSSIDPKQIKK